MYHEALNGNGDTFMVYESPLMPGSIFIWHGGAYIDLCDEDKEGTFTFLDTRYKYTQFNINVWDYLTDKPTIEWKDRTAFIAECEDFLQYREG
jgi:hypothetical protein